MRGESKQRKDGLSRREVLARLRGLELANSQLLYAIPEDRTLGSPTVREVARVLDAAVLEGDDELDRHVQGFVVAAMHLANFLARLEEPSLFARRVLA